MNKQNIIYHWNQMSNIVLLESPVASFTNMVNSNLSMDKNLHAGKVRGKITYPVLNFNGATFEV